MPKLKINAPDGKVIRIDVPEGSTPDQYDSIVDDVLKDYEMSNIETGTLESGARGLMSGIPGATAAVSGIQALGDKTYEETRRANELESDKAWEEHPVAYGAGKTAGIAGTALALPASIPAAIGVGAASGLDAATSIEDMPMDVLKGSAMGGAFGAAGKYVAEPLINAGVQKLAPALGKRAVASLGKPTLQDVESYLKNPEAIRNALTDPQMAEKLASTVGDVGEQTGTMSKAARGMLDPENAPITTPLPKLPQESTGLVNSSGQEIMKDLTKDQTIVPDTLTPIFEELKSGYLQSGIPKSAGAEAAINALDAQFRRIQKIAQATGGRLDEAAMKEQIVELQQLARKAFTDDNVTSTSKEALKNLSGALNGILKEANPAYGEAMVPVAGRTGFMKDIADKFSLEATDAGYAPTEATVTKVGNILKENKTESQDLLQQLQELTGIDFLDLARKAKTSQAFNDGGSSQGMNVVAHAGGYGLGALSNIPGGRLVGSLLGGVAGHNIDGGQVAKKILDAYISGSAKFSNSAAQKALQKYGPVLVKAAKQGGNQLAATHFVLGTSDPEYQALSQELEGQEQ